MIHVLSSHDPKAEKNTNKYGVHYHGLVFLDVFISLLQTLGQDLLFALLLLLLLLFIFILLLQRLHLLPQVSSAFLYGWRDFFSPFVLYLLRVQFWRGQPFDWKPEERERSEICLIREKSIHHKTCICFLDNIFKELNRS